jgi:hypothetical protein
MQEYARQCGLRRWMIPVPVLTPRLSSLWLGLVTPVYARIGRKLIDSMRNPTLVHDNSALTDHELGLVAEMKVPKRSRELFTMKTRNLP